MKVAILAGGFGSRLAEETEVRPKPMVEIGGYPILWHIMQHYAHYGFSDFVIGLGYKGEYIKKYFVDYCSLDGNVLVDFKTRRVATNGDDLDWKVNLIETGIRQIPAAASSVLRVILQMRPLCSLGVTVFPT